LFYSCWRGFVIRAKKDLKFLKYKAQVADLRQRGEFGKKKVCSYKLGLLYIIGNQRYREYFGT